MKPMRIAQVSTIASVVRQNAYGSVESLIWLMTRELARRGHQVTVFGVAGSEVDGEVVETLPGPYGENDSLEDWHLCEWVNLCQAVQQSGRFDVLHSHAYLWGLPLEPLSSAPMVHTMHIVPEEDSARLWTRSPNACVTAISHHQWSALPQLRPAAIIPHGVDGTQFTLRLSRMTTSVTWGGSRPAREPARRSQRRARPACGCSWRDRPVLTSGKRCSRWWTGARWRIGPIKGPERDKLLGGAKALVYPIEYAESFGLVLVEAMLCGTPVAAMRLGAVPEIVNEGVNGFSVESLAQMPEAITRCFSLDRRRVRQVAEERFSVERMTDGYLVCSSR